MSTDTTTTGTQLVPRSRVFPWPMQPRKHFDLEYLNELAASIEKHGILNDLICRPRAGGSDELEIIGGECRWRSAEMAGLDLVPVKVRAMTDGDALELALVDNMKRKDLTALEECDAFHQALEQRDESGIPRYLTIDDFAAKIGVSAGYVKQRLSLQKLPPSGRKAMDREELSFRVARVICGCPAAIVEDVLNHVLFPERYNVWLPGIGFVDEPLNAEKTQLLIEDQFVRKLSQAPFELDDEKLLPVHASESGERIEGGACTDCPWNLANQPEELGGDDSEKKGLGRPRGGDAKTNCLQPKCFARKVEIHTSLALVKAKEEGCTILQGKDAEKILEGSPSGTLSYSYVDLDEKVPPEERAKGVTDRKAPTWGKVVFGTASSKVVTGRNSEGEATRERVEGEVSVPVIVAVDARGKVHRLVERKVAVAAASKTELAPLLNLSAGRAQSLQDEDSRAKQQKEREAARLRNEVTYAVVDEVIKAVATEDMSKKEFVSEFWAWMIGIAAWHGGSDAAHFVTKRLSLEGSDQYDAVEKHAKKLVTMGERRAFAIELLIGRLVKFSGVDDKHFRALCKLYKVDIAAIEKLVKAAKKQKAEVRGQKPEQKKKPGKKAAKKTAPEAEEKDPTAAQFPGEVDGVLMPFVWYGERILFLESFDGFHVTLEDPSLPRRTSAVCIMEHQARELKCPTQEEVVDYSAGKFELPGRYVERCDDTLIDHFLNTVRTPTEEVEATPAKTKKPAKADKTKAPKAAKKALAKGKLMTAAARAKLVSAMKARWAKRGSAK